ncbi:MAG TPA: ATP phosphoribosyltransferase regulatory subunit [Pyrinomonadaceae bacterium]|nr:ATP phosphoribosyltransferase regulatory subunit [Pyrinomonadaceae bacterium]
MSGPLSKIPTGMRYYSGPEARLRRSIEDSLVSIFAGWSYEEITTPTIDYYALFEHGMGRSLAHHAFRFTDTDGSMLALRPDVTSLVARAAATLFAEVKRPLRLCYVAPVFRQQPQSHAEWRRESTQIGGELIGANSSAADMEVLAIVCEVLERLDLDRHCSITLNDVEVFNGIAEQLNLRPQARNEMRELVDTRNAADLERFLARYSSLEDSHSFAQLIQLSGKRNILSDARRLIANPRSQLALDRLESLWSAIESLQLADRFDIDLGDVSRLDYYTGLTFKIYVKGAGARVGSGGRYDGLTASFGRAEPAVGFVLELDALTDVLLDRASEPTLVASSSGETAQLRASNLSDLFRDAREKRTKAERIMINLSEAVQ